MRIALGRHLSYARLRQFALGGAASVASIALATNVLRLFSNVALTRLLDPAAFGVVSIIVSVQLVVTLFADVGLYDFIVQHREGDEERFRDQLWSIRLVRGAILTAVMMALSHPVAAALGKPMLGPVIALWSVSFLFEGASALSFALGVRAQQFWRLGLLELSANVATTAVSIVIAILLHSYWAMVSGMLAGAAVKMVLSYAMFAGSRRRWCFDAARARELWAFSRYIAMSSILTLVLMQSDKLVLAGIMPLAAFGLYGIATTLATAPAQLAMPYTTQVLLAAYAEAARTGKEALRAIYYRRRRKVALLYMFGVGGMIGAAPLIVAILYQPRYHAVTPFLQLLLISTALRFPNYSAKWALIALGETRATLISNVCAALWLAGGCGLALWTGNIMVLVATVGTSELPSLLYYWRCLRRYGLLEVRGEALELGSAVLGAGAGWAVATIAFGLFPRL